ncbi:MAG: hypothetical protein ACRDYD_00755, partial [Acidimicrobiales bacterium]
PAPALDWVVPPAAARALETAGPLAGPEGEAALATDEGASVMPAVTRTTAPETRAARARDSAAPDRFR